VSAVHGLPATVMLGFLVRASQGSRNPLVAVRTLTLSAFCAVWGAGLRQRQQERQGAVPAGQRAFRAACGLPEKVAHLEPCNGAPMLLRALAGAG
jgi:hypothetical protein